MIDVVEGERVELSHVVGYADGEADLDVPGFGIALIDICLQKCSSKEEGTNYLRWP